MKKVNGVYLPAEEEREYKIIKLDSGVQALLINDKTTSISSAALSVGVGSFSDFEDTEEHMLFFGTEKYPDENSYNTYINANGGKVNAYTLSESTTYIFDVKSEALDDALDRFAQFFISPLLTETKTTLELEAIESEHSKNVENDSWRMYRLIGCTSSSKHPISRFSTGNTETLLSHKDIHQRLIKFYTENYSAQIIKLVVLGNSGIENLESSVRSKFSLVRRVEVKSRVLNEVPFESEHLGKLVKYLPVQEKRCLSLVFPMPSVNKHFRSKPVEYISHLIGHESAGSIFAYLKSHGLAVSLESGLSHSHADCSIFTISVDLTELGLQSVNMILEIIFSFVHLIHVSGITQDLFEELAHLKKLEFRFQEKKEHFNYVAHLADCMQIYPDEYVIAGDYVMEDYDPQLIKQFLSHVSPRNMRVFLCAPEIGIVNQYTEKYYQINYSVDPMDPAQLDRLDGIMNGLPTEMFQNGTAYSGKIFVPRLNPFIPENLNLVPCESGLPEDPPRLVMNDCKIRFWFKQDAKFRVPKSSLILCLYSTYNYVTPEASLKANFLVSMLNLALNELSYDASMAGLNFNLINTTTGLQISVFGYNCKLFTLMDHILNTLFSDFFSVQLFDLVQEMLKIKFRNHEFKSPYHLALYEIPQVMENTRWSFKQYLHYLPLITIEQVREWRELCLQHVFIEGLYYGNETNSNLEIFIQSLLNKFSGPALLENQFPIPRLIKLSKGEEYWIQKNVPNPREKNHSIVNYYQIDFTNRSLAMSIKFIVQILKSEFFNVLRSEEQLGYITFMWNECNYCVEGVLVCIQSVNYDPLYLDQRIENFLHLALSEYLENISDDVWETHRSSLISEQLKPATNIKKQAQRYWEAIDYPKQYDFHQHLENVNVLKEISREHVLQVYKQYICPDGPKRAKLSVQYWSSSTQIKEPRKENVVVLKDSYQLRKFFPLHGVLPFGKPIVTQC